MTVFCITQARMNSSRLPGKILKPINEIPLIKYHLQHVAQAKNIDRHIIATTDSLADTPLVEFCQQLKQAYFCGDEHNVLSRFYDAAVDAGAGDEDLIIRLTADCPLICPKLIDEVITSHRAHTQAEYSHVNLLYFPRGLDVEIFSMKTLRYVFYHASTVAEREHVTLLINGNPNVYNINSINTGKKEWSDLRLCVDEPLDFKLVSEVIQRLGSDYLLASAAEICQLLKADPALAGINASVRQKVLHK
jgi:spore coat polysaccharide biosynthesis protein SpsF